MNDKIVRYRLDPNNRPPLTPTQKAEIEVLRSLPDSDINYSDIPPLTEKFWKNAVRNPYFRPVKQQLTLRLDADLIAWFKRNAPEGKGYQSDINRALRDYVEQRRAERTSSVAG